MAGDQLTKDAALDDGRGGAVHAIYAVGNDNQDVLRGFRKFGVVQVSVVRYASQLTSERAIRGGV